MNYCSKSREFFIFFYFFGKKFDAARKNKHTKLQSYWPKAKQDHQVFVKYSQKEVHHMFSRKMNYKFS